MDSFLTKNDRLKARIMTLLSSGGQKTPSAMAADLDCKYETVSKGLVFLEKLGLVRCRRLTRGSRGYDYYTLTEFGRKVAEHVKRT